MKSTGILSSNETGLHGEKIIIHNHFDDQENIYLDLNADWMKLYICIINIAKINLLIKYIMNALLYTVFGPNVTTSVDKRVQYCSKKWLCRDMESLSAWLAALVVTVDFQNKRSIVTQRFENLLLLARPRNNQMVGEMWNEPP